jgi:hypothetical protein
MKSISRAAALLLAALLCLPSVVLPSDPPSQITVTLSLAEADSGFYVMPRPYAVSADLSDVYGYDDGVDGVSMLDAVIKLHELAFGDGLTDALVIGSGGFATTFFGTPDGNVGGALNGVIPDTPFGETPLSDADTLEFFLYADEWGMDAYTWFEQDDIRTDRITVTAGEEAELRLTGTIAFGWGDWNSGEATFTDQGVSIVALDVAQSGEFDVGYCGDPLVTPESDGTFTLSFAEPGVYFISAVGYDDYYEVPIIPPLLTVEVTVWGGSGTANDPYTLGGAAALEALRDAVNGGETFAGTHFRLNRAVSLPAGWVPIGVSGTDNLFNGVFDGGGNTLSFAYGSRPLFGIIGNAAEVKNLNIFGAYIASHGLMEGFVKSNVFPSGSNAFAVIDNVTLKSGTRVKYSGFAGDNGATVFQVKISNCTVESDVKIGWDADADAPAAQAALTGPFGNSAPGVGSFIGGLAGSVTNCVSYAEVYGQSNVGGIAGYKAQSQRPFDIENCVFGGAILATGNNVGGIVGGGYIASSAPNARALRVNNCYVTGSVTGGGRVGGIVGGEETRGYNNQEVNLGRIRNNHFAGEVSAADGGAVGGIIGYMHTLNAYFIITNNYYAQGCGADRGIGTAANVNTGYENPTAVAGTEYQNTSGATLRSDDPLGADADTLAKAVTAAQLQDGTVKAWLNGGEGSFGKWAQMPGSAYPTLGYDIIVEFTLLGDFVHDPAYDGPIHTLYDGNLTEWLPKAAYTVLCDATVLDLLEQALTGAGIAWDNRGNYIYSLTKDGVTLAAASNGRLSGWMYTLNGKYSDYGVEEQPLADGDSVVFHYSDDYTKEDYWDVAQDGAAVTSAHFNSWLWWGGATLAAAAYGDDGRLLGVKLVPCTLPGDAEIGIAVPPGGCVKLMLWEDTDLMSPICRAKTITE